MLPIYHEKGEVLLPGVFDKKYNLLYKSEVAKLGSKAVNQT
jgi:hypothetical protein